MPVHERSEKEYFTRRRDGWVSTRVSNLATRLRFQNILYATDLSFAAERALPYALEIARRYGATIHVVHVIQPDVYPLVPPSAWSKMAEAEEVFREESKRDLEEQLKSVPHEIIFRPGKTWPILSQLIEEKQIDLVVFSTHGGGGLQKLIFGSVADDTFSKVTLSYFGSRSRCTNQTKSECGAESNPLRYGFQGRIASRCSLCDLTCPRASRTAHFAAFDRE